MSNLIVNVLRRLFIYVQRGNVERLLYDTLFFFFFFFIRNEHEDEQLCGSETARSSVLIADVLCQPLTGQPFIRGLRRDKKNAFCIMQDNQAGQVWDRCAATSALRLPTEHPRRVN